MNVEVGPRRPSAHLAARPGRYVRVEVSYLTTAAPAAARPQRRDTDEGTVAALEALRRAGGRLMVDTDGARVASVVLLLPSDGVTVLKPRATAAPRSTGRTVVLIETDPTHRRLLQAVLRGQGHDVETVASPREAERLLELEPDAVLVTDQLPGDTPAASAAWLAARPGLRVLGTAEPVAHAIALMARPGPVAAIARPLDATEITDAVASLFDGQAGVDASGVDRSLPQIWLKHDAGEPIHPLEAS
jgi:CheY-like chemotaxis protein